MAGRHKRLISPYTNLVLCVYISMLVASHRFLSLALISGLDWKQGFDAFVRAARGRVGAPGALLSHFWEHWPVEVPTCESGQRSRGRAEAGAAAAGVLWLQTAAGAG